jgi:hypothetical protein
MFMKTLARRAASALFLIGFTTAAHSQAATGIYNHGTFDYQGVDTINVGNLNVHFDLSILNRAGRGLPFYYNLSYDSSVWAPTTVSGTTSWVPVQNFGWLGQTDGPLGYLTYSSGSSQCSGDNGSETYSYRTNYVYTDQFGVAHAFPNITILIGPDKWLCSGLTRTGSDTTTDGSGYSIGVNSTVNTISTKSGSTITPPIGGAAASGVVVDSNGNEISLDGSGHFTDTTGKTALTVAGSAPNPLTFTYTDTNGNPQSTQITYKTYVVQTAFGCSGIGEYGPTSVSLVDTITFPDGSAYHFSYEPTPGHSGNVTGRLTGVELPQGGSIGYSYSGNNNGIECADGSTAALKRTLNSDSGSASSTWSYTRSSPNGTGTSHTEVVDGLSNHKAYDFVGRYETNRSIYQGAETGTPVIARQTCYNNALPPCTTKTISLPVSWIDTYETVDGIQMHGTRAIYNTFGMQTEADVYDFGGSSSRGAPSY